MRFFILVTSTILLSIIIFACGGPTSQNDPSNPIQEDEPSVQHNGDGPSQLKEADIVIGKRIFELHCKICHGVDGTLGLNGARDLTISPLSLDEMILVISEGRNTMTAFENVLSAQEIFDVANYVKSLKL